MKRDRFSPLQFFASFPDIWLFWRIIPGPSEPRDLRKPLAEHCLWKRNAVSSQPFFRHATVLPGEKFPACSGQMHRQHNGAGAALEHRPIKAGGKQRGLPARKRDSGIATVNFELAIHDAENVKAVVANQPLVVR